MCLVLMKRPSAVVNNTEVSSFAVTFCAFPPSITYVGTYNTIQYNTIQNVTISSVHIFYQFKISIECLIFLFMTLNYSQQISVKNKVRK